jgi:hypothetical protein
MIYCSHCKTFIHCLPPWSPTERVRCPKCLHEWERVEKFDAWTKSASYQFKPKAQKNKMRV